MKALLKIFLVIVLLGGVLSVGITFYRTIILRHYEIIGGEE